MPGCGLVERLGDFSGVFRSVLLALAGAEVRPVRGVVGTLGFLIGTDLCVHDNECVPEPEGLRGSSFVCGLREEARGLRFLIDTALGVHGNECLSVPDEDRARGFSPLCGVDGRVGDFGGVSRSVLLALVGAEVRPVRGTVGSLGFLIDTDLGVHGNARSVPPALVGAEVRPVRGVIGSLGFLIDGDPGVHGNECVPNEDRARGFPPLCGPDGRLGDFGGVLRSVLLVLVGAEVRPVRGLVGRLGFLIDRDPGCNDCVSDKEAARGLLLVLLGAEIRPVRAVVGGLGFLIDGDPGCNECVPKPEG